MTEQRNPFDYEYKPNDVVEIPANALLNIMHYCTKVIESQPSMAVPYTYPEDSKVKKDKDGNITDVIVNWKTYGQGDMQAFFKSAGQPIPVATELSLLSEQVFHALDVVHSKNIDKGIAKKRGELTKENKDESSVLDKPRKKSN